MSSEEYLPDVLSAGQAEEPSYTPETKSSSRTSPLPASGPRDPRDSGTGSAGFESRVFWPRPSLVVISEQLIENALLLREVGADVRKALDFGGFESMLPLALAGLGVDVTVVDQRRYPFRHDRLHVVQHDILNPRVIAQPISIWSTSFPPSSTSASATTVILGRRTGMRLAVANLWEKVRSGGRLFISVPAGEAYEQRGNYRIYSPETLEPDSSRHRAGPVLSEAWRGEAVWRECAAAGNSRATDTRIQPADFPVEGVAIAIVQNRRHEELSRSHALAR